MKKTVFYRAFFVVLFFVATAVGRCVALAQETLSQSSGLNTSIQLAKIPGGTIYSQRPMTVECYASINNASSYNILVANEPKSSATHWEIFTTPENGFLTAYLPGCTPDHVRTSVKITDRNWHYIALTLEDNRARLFADGQLAGELSITRRVGTQGNGALVFGALDEGDLGCNGVIRWVRISSTARDIKGILSNSIKADDQTIGLWMFDQPFTNKVVDISSQHRAAVISVTHNVSLETGIWPRLIQGGMSTAFRPMPPLRDVSGDRSKLVKTISETGLKTVSATSLRDGVLRYWMTEYANWRSNIFAPGQLEYPQARQLRPTFNKDKVAQQAYDTNALIWESDVSALGTAIRRAGALLDYLSRENPRLDLQALKQDFQILKSRATESVLDTKHPENLGLYLAVCALRREVAFRNPLLNFDQLLCVARGTFEGSVRSNPTTADVQGGHFVTQYFGFNALPGGGLYVLHDFKTSPRLVNILENSIVQNGRFKGQKLDHGAFATPDLSFDGKQIVFAWTANHEHKWIYSANTVFHLFKVNADGTDLTQLTDGTEGDFDPCWLPSGRIAFVSERRGGFIRCFSGLQVRTFTLFSMNANGSNIVPLSYYETSEWNPSVNNDGQLVFTRWDYTDRENCLGTRFWISGPDGTDPRAPHGNYPLPYHTFPDHQPWRGGGADSRIGAPLVEMGIRAIPHSRLYAFTAAPHHGEIYGSIGLLDVRQPDDGHMSQVKRFTPDEPFPESELGSRLHYKYGTPWPLSEDFMLCNAWENLVLVDRFGNKELIAEHALLPCLQDERLRIIDPIPLRARPQPPELTSKTSLSAKSLSKHPATISILNVYDSDLPFPAGVKIKWLRVTQNILKENHEMGQPMIGNERENTPRVPLGIVPVEEDGSVYFEAPVAKELIFQVLDENYCAVQSMRSVAFVHPGEQLNCQGCHENPRQSPPSPKHPIAFKRPPSVLRPELGKIEPISYYRQIKPIFENTCVKCHVKEKKGPQDMSYAALREDMFWFSGAMLGDMATAYSGIHGGSRTIPGRFGARYCRIGRALSDESHLKRVSPEERHTIDLWLDSNSPRLGAYENEAAQLRGELVWPVLDIDPRNILGTETTNPQLTRNFWHENLRGPYACLISEHAHDRIALLNERGEVVWEYSLPHPQDVWMLTNGNILTTYYQGVREITRNKEIVWEYKTKNPNEIPNCQPLPDGNVLIGIVGECRLIEVNRNGKIVHEIKLQTTEKNPHAQFRMCRKTPEGTYLVPFTAEGAVREYNAQGAVIHEFPCESTPVAALRLPNGNTLISAGQAITEYDSTDNIVWRMNADWMPDIQLGTLAGLQRLPNGNTIVCNWNTHDTPNQTGAHIFEVTPDKRILWQVTGNHIGQVAHCQILTPDFHPLDQDIIR